MGMFTHLGGMRIGTVKDGASANCGAVIASQTNTLTYAADGTVTTAFNLPAGAQIINFDIDTTTAFNAGTTNTIKVGTTSGGAELVAATSCTSLGRQSVATTAVYSAWMIGTSDVTVYVTYNQTGTAASTGAARVTAVYTVKNSDATIVNPA